MPLDCIDCLRIGLKLEEIQKAKRGGRADTSLYLPLLRMTVDMETMAVVRDEDFEHGSLEELRLVKVDTALRQRGYGTLKRDPIEFQVQYQEMDILQAVDELQGRDRGFALEIRDHE